MNKEIKQIIDKYYPGEKSGDETEKKLKLLLIVHSYMVAGKAARCAAAHPELQLDLEFVENAAMIHDIGIRNSNAPSIFCNGPLPYILHGLEGGRIMREEGDFEAYARVCERHTGAGLSAQEIEKEDLPLPHRDFLPETLEEKLICYADKFYSKSGNPEKEKSLDEVRESMARHGEEVLARFNTLHSLFGE